MTSDWTWTTKHSISSDPSIGRKLIDQILDQLKQANWSGRDLFGIDLSLEEAIVNAIKHGNAESDDKQVHVECKLSPTRFWIRIVDEGPGFNPEDVPDCKENLEKPSGRGLELMRSYMTRVEYNDTGNEVVMEKDLTPAT